MARCLLALVATVVVLALGPGAAMAAQQYAAPSGSLSSDCSQAEPCEIHRAFSNAGANDEVIITAGDYGSAAAPLPGEIGSSQPGLDVHGEDGKPRPRVFVDTSASVPGDTSALRLTGQGTKARHLEVHLRLGSSRHAALVLDNAEASEIVARNLAPQGRACVVLHDSLLTNSLCEATAMDAKGIATYTSGGPGAPNNSVLRNVTAIASSASGGIGIEAFAGNNAGEDQHLTVTNAIARGSYADVAASAGSGALGIAIVTIDHSNFGFESWPTPGPDRVVDGPGGGNQRFIAVNFVAAGDFHQAAGSPTIDKGATSVENGPSDFDGDPRALGIGGTDIGADEFVPPPLAVTGDPGAVTTNLLLSLGLSHRTFASAARGGSVKTAARRRRRPPIGTTVTFRLSEAAGVRFTVERERPGRRAGGRCVKPRKRNRRAPKCKRFVRLRGNFSVNGAAGQNRFRFTGRLRKRKLAKGRYRLVGNVAGDRERARFRIVPRS